MSKLVFFSASDGVHGIELWVTDGTSSGTRMVKDILPPEANPFDDPYFDSSDPGYLVPIGGGRILFRAQDENFRRTELWVSDGTEEGTALLIDLDPDSSATPSYLTPLGDGRVVFSASGADDDGTELWITDGTAAGTQKLKTINPNEDYPYSSHPYGFKQVANGRLIFTADDGSNGRELWTTDGTPDGTYMLREFNLGSGNSNISSNNYLDLPGGRVAFSAFDGTDYNYWVTDGTAGGTTRLGGSEFTSDQHEMPGGRLLIKGAYADGKYPFYVSDGTIEGTHEINTPVNVSGPPPDPFFFELGADEGLFPVEPSYGWANMPRQQLGDGRLLFSVQTEELKEIAGSDGTIYETRWSYGEQLWVTDGSQGGTQLVERFNMGNPWPDQNTLPPGYIVIPPPDQEELAPTSAPHDFFLLENGKVAFVARTAEDQSDLYITDGSSGGTFLATANVTNIGFSVPWSESTTVFVIEQGDAPGIWRTDGTSNGTHLLVPNGTLALYNSGTSFDDAIEIDDGGWLIETNTSDGYQTWLIDAAADTASKVLDDRIPFEMQNFAGVPLLTSMGDGKYLTSTRTGDVGIWEPWVLDVNAGTFEVLKDINPGSASGQFGYPVAVTPADQIPIPVSTLFPVKVSLEEQTSSFDLDDYFVDPTGSELNYIVTGTPDEITVNATTSVITATGNVEAGEYAITVTARNPEGGTVTSSFDWSVVDTGNLTIATTGDWGRETPGGPIVATEGSVLTIGRKDGTAQLFRIEPLDPTVPDGQTKPIAKIENGKILLEGKLYSEQVSSTKPLMEGKFTIDMAKVEVSGFEDANSNTDYRLVADLIDLQFSNITIDRDKINFRTDLAFDDGNGTGPSYSALSTTGAPLSVSFGADGLGFGVFGDVERWSPDPVEFDLGGGSGISIGFSDLGVDYESSTDSIYLNGKATVGWGGAIDNGFDFLDNDSEQSLTIDLAGTAQQGNFFQRGDKYLKISAGPTGWDWGVVGEIKYEDKYEGTVPSNGFLVKELVVGFDTVSDTYSGGFKANIPLFFGLDLSASLGFVSNPNLALDKINVGVDGLNYPIGTTGIFVQGGSLGLENLAIADPAAGWTYKADLTGTFGPDTDIIKSPLHGTIGGTIKEVPVGSSTGYVLTGSLGVDSKIGYFVPEIINKFATPLIDYFGIDAAAVTAFELLNANSTTQLDFTKDRDQLDASINLLGGVVTGSAQLINAPHGTLKDVRSISASVSASVQMPEDFPLVGGMTRSGKALVTYSSDNVFSNDKVAFWSEITIPLGFTSRVYAFGAQFTLEGDYTFLGRKDIPKTSSWALDESLDLVILSADWEVSATDVAIELIAPDGTVLTEADIAARSDLAIVEDLNTTTSRHVALEQPATGTWDLRLADPTGLGIIEFEASTMLANPVAAIDTLTPNPDSHVAEILVSLDSGDATTAQVVIFAAQDTGQTTGVELGRVTVAAGDPPFAQTIDYDALGPGDWHIYTRTEADGMVPMIQMHPTPITITGAADLNTSAQQTTHAGTGSPIVTITVTNDGDRPSEPGKLDIKVPDGMVGGDAIPDIGAIPLDDRESELDLPALAPGESLTIKIALPLGADDLSDAVFIDVWTPGFDADPTNNGFAQVLKADENTPPTGTVVITGVAQEGQLLTADISSINDPDTMNIDTLAYQWQRNGVDIPGSDADGESYLLTPQDVGAKISVKATYIDGGGTQEELISATVLPLLADLLINGTSGPDSLPGGVGDDTIYGLDGDDILEGVAGDDDLYGGSGDDRLEGGKGLDNLDGGDGEDYAAYFSAAAGVDVDLSAGIALDDGEGGLDLLYGIEHIFGSFYDDKLTGDDYDNTFIGLAGNDTIDGGAGFDEVYYGNASSAVTVDLSNGTASGGSDNDTLSNIEWVTGSDYNDRISGDSGETLLSGLSGNDTILGREGADSLVGGRGDDVLDGGDGFDTAMFDAPQSAFTLTLSPDRIIMTDRRADGLGTDELKSIEFLDFEPEIELFDGPMNFDIFSGPTGLNSDEFSAIVELYIAYFNRAPDAIGLNYWATDFTNGYTLPEMALSFFVQPETRATYADVLDENFQLDLTDRSKIGDFITEVYHNVLGRAPDTPGFNYWLNDLENNPDISPDIFILAILNGAKYPSEPTDLTAIDQIYLANKVEVGAYFSVIKGMSDVDDAASAMALFTGSQDSIDETVAAIDGHYADALNAETGDFLMPLVGVIDDPFAVS